MNYYVRVYLIKNINGEYAILYGYAIEIERSEKSWSKSNYKKTPIKIISCVVNEDNLNKLILKLQKKKLNLKIKDKDIKILGGLIKRPTVIIPPKESHIDKSTSIINTVSIVDSYWNIDKVDLIELIKILSKSSNEKEFRKFFNILLDGLLDETGMNFKEEAVSKLGNFEVYNLLLSNEYFDIYVDKTSKGKVCHIKKCKEIEYELITRCKLKNGKECILDTIKEFREDEKELIFKAKQSIENVEIEMWKKETRELVYVYSTSIIRYVSVGMKIQGKNLLIRDPWSDELRNSYSKGKNQIDKIEQVSLYSSDKINICGNKDEDVWDDVASEAEKLVFRYSNKSIKGCFIEISTSKMGEIESFVKLRKYLNENDLNRVVIVDPYFSVKAASKLLARIENTSMILEIITSLSEIDPDSNKSNPNIIPEVKNFLEKNYSIIHRKLKVVNITSGKKQAFHDRYLIRFFNNGDIDGFLLSNSINSMGQRFPFVIAPMESEVVFQVWQYLKETKNNKKYDIEELWNYSMSKTSYPIIEDKNVSEEKEYIIGEMIKISGYEELLVKYTKENDLSIERFLQQNDVNVLLNNFMNKYKNHTNKANKKELLKFMGKLLYYTTEIRYINICNKFKESEINITEIGNLIKELAEESENQDVSFDINDDRYIYSKFLQKCNEWDNSIDAIEYSRGVFRNIRPIYGSSTDFHMYYLYKIILHFNPEKIEAIIKETRSPLAYSEMIEFMMLNWNEALYLSMLNSKIKTFKETAYAWIWQKVKDIKEKSNKEIFIDNAIAISSDVKYEIIAYLVSCLTYSIKYYKVDYKELKYKYIKELAEELNKLKLNKEQVRILAYILNNRQDAESALDMLTICEHITSNNFVKSGLLSEIINKLTMKLNVEKVNYFYETDRKFTCYSAKAVLELNNGKITEEIFKQFVNKKDFFTFSIPYLKDRNYSKWYDSGLKSMWRLLFLSDLINNLKPKNKEIFAKYVVEVFSEFLEPQIWQWDDRKHMLLEFITYVGMWLKDGVIENSFLDDISFLKSLPNWAKILIDLLYIDVNSIYKIQDLIYNTIEINSLDDNRVVIESIGEFIVYRKLIERDKNIKEKLNSIKDYFINNWMKGNEDYANYLRWLEKGDMSNDTLRWKNRGTGYKFILVYREGKI
ncbi:hypothetical protein KM800_04565 [Clostridium tyrobutyricum]|uniref:VPA1262 family N-terminal domain-containing protein n=1 Tax=Clostridium tyrobutyricum TaxID=1519 RepID=UPI001C383948|nr:VPA1262 family N-terminal domain-containing protein [Clostridium tyrobutyricum]MBV4418601.1 hypothetical protein [Clostridium tyrobutyricum]